MYCYRFLKVNVQFLLDVSVKLM